MICFDTDVLSVFLRRGAPPSAQRRLAGLPPDSQFTTSISLGELLYGAERRRNASLTRSIEEYVQGGVSILPFDEQAARTYADIRVTLEREGRRLDDPDLRIAAICLSRGLTLVTGNLKHFSRVSGLTAENWLE